MKGPAEWFTGTVVKEVAANRGATPAQIALAFILAKKNVITIPKTSSPTRVTENYKAAEITLTALESDLLDKAFPPPTENKALKLGW
ncbi:aldo/keto reductase [Rhizobium sp. Root708]|uniref:aldo/keto reductase n=1 Tax=Rhizobium sp. Root708 TaxID=1736592 RepID=UPI0009EB0693